MMPVGGNSLYRYEEQHREHQQDGQGGIKKHFLGVIPVVEHNQLVMQGIDFR